jgi:hypothetical protein
MERDCQNITATQRVCNGPLRNFLETLRAEGKVDRFQVPVASGSGKPKTVYRATTKLVESD